jgi:hypothetical protein
MATGRGIMSGGKSERESNDGQEEVIRRRKWTRLSTTVYE